MLVIIFYKRLFLNKFFYYIWGAVQEFATREKLKIVLFVEPVNEIGSDIFKQIP